jgi:hypothetical protein
MTRLARFIPLFVTAWLVGSTVISNDRVCSFRDYRGRTHTLTIAAAKLCPNSIEVPSG